MTVEITPAEQAVMDQEEAIASKLVDALWIKSERDNADAGGVSYSLFIWMVHILLELGWPVEQLQDDIAAHKVIHDKNNEKDSGEPTVTADPATSSDTDDETSIEEDIADEALDLLLEKSTTRDACGHCAAAFLFVDLIHFLKDTGMDPAEMQRLVIWHAADAGGPKQ